MGAGSCAICDISRQSPSIRDLFPKQYKNLEAMLSKRLIKKVRGNLAPWDLQRMLTSKSLAVAKFARPILRLLFTTNPSVRGSGALRLALCGLPRLDHSKQQVDVNAIGICEQNAHVFCMSVFQKRYKRSA